MATCLLIHKSLRDKRYNELLKQISSPSDQRLHDEKTTTSSETADLSPQFHVDVPCHGLPNPLQHEYAVLSCPVRVCALQIILRYDILAVQDLRDQTVIDLLLARVNQ